MPRQNRLTGNPQTALRVVAAIIENANGEFLIAERPEHKPAAGLWEFPGGKVENGEDDRSALLRELDEELGINLAEEHFTFFSASENKQLTLVFYHIRLKAGISPQGREGQRWRWVKREALRDYPFPTPNFAVVDLLMANGAN